MRVLILTIYHDPEPIPKTGELARELHRRGHDVTVVTAFPHYPTGDLYAGYRLALWRWENRSGVRVLRTYIFPYHGKRSALRMLNYLTWMLSSMQAAWLAPRCDVLYVWHPPLTVGVSAWIIAKLKRVKFVYDVQDLWPESALASGLMKPGVVVEVLHRLADWVYARAPRILVVSEAAGRSLRSRVADGTKIVVARHWVDTAAFHGESLRDVRQEFGWGDRFVVMFAGNLGMVQGLETVIETAVLLMGARHVHFVLVGDGADRARVEQLASQRGVANVQFVGRHPASEMPAFMRSADALLVHLRPSEIADYAVPTKILSYFAAARPVVCAAGGASAEMVTEAGAGMVTAPGDPGALASAVLRLAEMTSEERTRLGTNGRRYLDTNLDKEHVIDFYERQLLEMAKIRHPQTEAARQRT